MRNYLFVFLGGMSGATLRFVVQSFFTTYTALWIVNFTGSFLLGCLNGVFFRKKNEQWRLFLTTGLLGAFTTFSAFSEAWFFMLKDHFILGLFFGISMTVCCFFSAFLGFCLFRGEG